jgi:hypothetical protein
MCGHVKRAALDPLLQQIAQQAVSQFGVLSGDTRDGATAVACAAWYWHKLFVKFVLHDFIIWQRLGEQGHLQGLISPEILIRMDKPEGDCAIFSMGIAAMLRCLGVPYEFVTVKVNRREPTLYGHVYLYAVMSDGRRIPLDASHGDYPGWQVPSKDIQFAANQNSSPALQVWDADGNKVDDLGSRFDGLHGFYGLRGGLGDVWDETPSTIDTSSIGDPGSVSSGTFDIYNPPLEPGGVSYQWETASGTPYQGPAYTVPSQSNAAAWANFANSLKGVLTLAEMTQLKPGMVISPNGTILQQNPGYAVPAGGTASFNTALGGNTIVYLGLAAVVLLGFSMMKGGR